MLCQACQTSIVSAFSELVSEVTSKSMDNVIASWHGPGTYVLHASHQSFYQSVTEGCFICRHICRTISGREDGKVTMNETSQLFAAKVPDGLIRFDAGPSRQSPTWGITDPYVWIKAGGSGKIVSHFTFLKGLGWNDRAIRSTSTDGEPGLWRKWFKECTDSHPECCAIEQKLPKFSPDRLIEIVIDDNQNTCGWKLTCRTDVGTVPYLTLSHCWGFSLHLCLQQANYASFLKKNALTNLPKTYQEAFKITVSLGFRFIWIDSMCIIQDDTDSKDWKTQSSMMGTIYENASCNVAATWAMDGNDGCFTVRDPALINSPMVSLPGPEPNRSSQYRVSIPEVYNQDITDAPLNSRGWVAQERYLSKRQLSFSARQVYWECKGLVASEQFVAGIPDALVEDKDAYGGVPPGVKPSMNLDDNESLRKAWIALISYYSGLKFTRSSDKLIALAGLVRRMREATGDEYLAGLWRKDLHRQLCWATDLSDVGADKRLDRVRISPYVAPTWSWTSIGAWISPDIIHVNPDLDILSCVEILDVTMQWDDPLKLYACSSGKLTLRGVAEWGCLIPIDNDQHSQECKVSIINKDGGDPLRTDIDIYWDENTSSATVDPLRWECLQQERYSNLLLMTTYLDGLCDNEFVAHGLLLKPQPGIPSGDTWLRVGTFTSEGFGDWLLGTLGMLPPFEESRDQLHRTILARATLAGNIRTVNIL